MKKNTNNPGTSMKCRFSNEVHRILEPNIEVKSSQRWKHRDRYNFTDEQKLEMINKILKLHTKLSQELTAYQWNRRQKKRVQKSRVERGYVPTKKTKLKDYLASKAS